LVDEQRKEEVKEKEQKQKSWWSRVPTPTKVITVVILFFTLATLRTRGWTLTESWWVIASAVAVLYLIGKGGQQEKDYYTPEEAKLLIENHIEWEKKRPNGTISMNSDFFVGPNIKLQKKKAIGMQYLIEVEIRDKDGLIQYKQGLVNFKVPGIPQLIASDSKVRGDELPDIKIIEPELLRLSQKYKGLGRLFGGGGGGLN